MILSAPTAKTKWKNDGHVRILCIEGFSRENGNTRVLLDKFISGFENAQVIEYNTYKENPRPCIGCDECRKSGKCIYRDLDRFFELFETADIIVIASPVYNLSFPAPLKALIDRFQKYYTGYFENGRTQQIKKRREGYLLATAGCAGDEGFYIMERQLKNAFSILNTEYKGGTLVGNTDKQYSL